MVTKERFEEFERLMNLNYSIMDVNEVEIKRTLSHWYIWIWPFQLEKARKLIKENRNLLDINQEYLNEICYSIK